MRHGHLELFLGALVFQLEFLDGMWTKMPLLAAIVFIVFLLLTGQGIAKLAASYIRDGFDEQPEQSLHELAAKRRASKPADAP